MEVGDLAPSLMLAPDAKSLVYQAYHNNTWDLYWARLDASPVTPVPLSSTAANEYGPQFSPDGKWVAFISDESGRAEVYVRSFPDPRSQVQVSAEGAQEMVWPGTGRTIYFRSGNTLLTATVEYTPSFRVVRRDTVQAMQMPNVSIFGANYDVARDGRIVGLFADRDNFELVVSPNWITEFRQRLAGSDGASRR